MPNLLDLMAEEDRQSVIRLRKHRSSTAQKGQTGATNLMIAKLGYYYGWSAIESVKRGYVQKGDKTIALGMPEVKMLVEMGDKVYAQNMIDMGQAICAGVASAMNDKKASTVFKQVMKRFIDKVKA